MAAYPAIAARDQTRWKHCPKCDEDKPLDEFGTNRSQRDGHNHRCRLCVRGHAREVREHLRTLPPKVKPKRLRVTSRLLGYTPVERVRRAVLHGARTQTEIARLTGLGKDEIGDQLAHLLLWTRELATRIKAGRRIYFPNPAAPPTPPPEVNDHADSDS